MQHKPCLLIVDDEKDIRDIISKYANFNEYDFDEAKNGLEAIRLIEENPKKYALVIMDVMMPELDGFSAAKSILKICNVPIVFLSARTDELDQLHGFSLGACDYINKPFSPKVLFAKIQSLLAMNSSNSIEEENIQIDDVELNFKAHACYKDGEIVKLSPKEIDLLFFLVRHKGEAVSREILMKEVWGYLYVEADRTLDTHIKLLRQKLSSIAHHISTVRGVGYRFD